MNKLALLLLLTVLAGCSSVTAVDEIRQQAEPLDVNQGDSIVLLGRRDAGHYQTDTNFVSCVGRQLESVDELTVFDEGEFVDTLFPWFEPRTAPKSLARLERILQDALVAEKLTDLNLRYLVWMDGHTETIDKAGSMSCAAGVGGAACFGLLSWNKLSFYEAIVWDIADMKEEGRVRVDSEGSNYVIGAVVPIPLLSQSKGDACKGMGKQLRSFFKLES